MTLRAIAWDIDGTLADSEPLHIRTLVTASRRWGVDLADLPGDTFRGIHMHDVWTALASRFPAAVTRSDWVAALEDQYTADAPTLRPLPGAVQAIRLFAAQGLRQVCVSNSSRRIVDANLAALAITRDIAFSISFNDVTRGKPDPEPYRLACERLGLPPAEVLAVEDSLTGLRSARAAGLRTAACGPGLTATDADIVVEHLDALVLWVEAERSTAPRPG